MADSGDFFGSVGDWFGDVMDGVKGPTIEALGYKIRGDSGQYDGIQQPAQPESPAATNMNGNGSSYSPMEIAAAVGAVVLVVGGVAFAMKSAG